MTEQQKRIALAQAVKPKIMLDQASAKGSYKSVPSSRHVPTPLICCKYELIPAPARQSPQFASIASAG